MASLVLTYPWPVAVRYIGAHLKVADIAECHAVYGEHVDPAAQLRHSVLMSDMGYVATDRDGIPVAALGAKEQYLLTGGAVVWMQSTARLALHSRASLKLGREVLRLFHHRWAELYNFVWAKNLTTLKWLEKLGFAIEPAYPYGARGELFHNVVHRREVQCATRHC